MNSRLGFLLCISVLLTILLPGCKKSGTDFAAIHNTNIKKARAAYNLYMVRHTMNGPKDEDELKKFLKTDADAKVKLERMGVSQDEVDAIFISERDGKPFKVRYGLKGIADHPIVFESVGVDGKRFVAFAVPRELDEAEYDQYWAQETETKPEVAAPYRRFDERAENCSAFVPFIDNRSD